MRGNIINIALSTLLMIQLIRFYFIVSFLVISCKTYTPHSFGGHYSIYTSEGIDAGLYLYPDSSYYYYSISLDRSSTGCWEVVGKDSIVMNSDWQPTGNEVAQYTITEAYNNPNLSNDSFYVSFSACNAFDSTFNTIVRNDKHTHLFENNQPHTFAKGDTIHIAMWYDLLYLDILLPPDVNSYTIHLPNIHLLVYQAMSNDLWIWDAKKKRLAGTHQFFHVTPKDQHIEDLYKKYGNSTNSGLIEAFRECCFPSKKG